MSNILPLILPVSFDLLLLFLIIITFIIYYYLIIIIFNNNKYEMRLIFVTCNNGPSELGQWHDSRCGDRGPGSKC